LSLEILNEVVPTISPEYFYKLQIAAGSSDPVELYDLVKIAFGETGPSGENLNLLSLMRNLADDYVKLPAFTLEKQLIEYILYLPSILQS
jgi:hypothetical protein